MQAYRYNSSFIVYADCYDEAKRLIEARIKAPMNTFRLEVQTNGKFKSFY